MNSFDRAEQVVTALNRAGVRASVDPSAVTPPAVLIVPPNRSFDLSCGYTAKWTLVALAPGALGADRTTWTQLDDLVDAVVKVVDVADAELVNWTLNGVSYPAYLLTFSEILS